MGSAWTHRDQLSAGGVIGLRILGVALAYYLAAVVGLLLSAPFGDPVRSLWIPAGVALVCLLTLGLRTWTWPGIAIGSLAATLPLLPPAAALLITLGNTLAPVCAYVLLRSVDFRKELDRLRDTLALVLIAAFGAMTISATLGAVAITFLTVGEPAGFLAVWAVWWSSDVLGVLVVTPFLLVLLRVRGAFGAGWVRWLEMALLLLVTFTVSMAATRSFGLLFLAFPLVIWAAWRFQLPGVAPCNLIVSGIAIDAAGHGYGLFAGRPLLANIMILQVFDGTVVLSGLFLAVVITAWRKSRAEIEQAVATLTDALARLQDSMLPGQKYLSMMRDIPHEPEVRKQNPDDD
ncbi:MASE1 domain-containing protein [Actinopolymorpha sp. B9G3]|uniref:MASE1 domain-containing protein n=1 Tax=Actinopolymorpha sp. B9G3 TaxID=3158970 RepID=UPI0032D94CA9